MTEYRWSGLPSGEPFGVPAFAGMTGGGAGMTVGDVGMYKLRDGWIPAFAGMTGGGAGMTVRE